MIIIAFNTNNIVYFYLKMDTVAVSEMFSNFCDLF